MKYIKSCCLSLLFFFVIEPSWGDNAKVKMPLEPVCGDSVSVCDFFWYDLLDMIKQKYPSVKSYEVKSLHKSDKQIEKMQIQWQKRLSKMSLTGCLRGLESSKASLSSAIKTARRSSDLAMLTGEGKYVDLLERALCNEICGTLNDSLSMVSKERAAEMIKAVPGWVYATSGENLFLNLFVRSDAHIKTKDFDVNVSLVGSMPWYNEMMLVFRSKKQNQHFVLHLRMPSWITTDILPNYTGQTGRIVHRVAVNGKNLLLHPQNGYITIDRVWNDKDVVHLMLPSPIIRVIPQIEPGKIALQRGALVYPFMSIPTNMKINIEDPISNNFDKSRETIVLTGKYYDATGKEQGKYEALPYAKTHFAKGIFVEK